MIALCREAGVSAVKGMPLEPKARRSGIDCGTL